MLNWNEIAFETPHRPQEAEDPAYHMPWIEGRRT